MILYSLEEKIVSGRNVSHSEPHFHSEASILPLTVLFLPLFLVFRTVVTFTQLYVTCRCAVMSIVYEEDVVAVSLLPILREETDSCVIMKGWQ